MQWNLEIWVSTLSDANPTPYGLSSTSGITCMEEISIGEAHKGF